MTKEDLKPGVSIKYKKPYKGEGEYIVEKLFGPNNGWVNLIRALNTRFPNSNGTLLGEPVEIVLEQYEPVQ